MMKRTSIGIFFIVLLAGMIGYIVQITEAFEAYPSVDIQNNTSHVHRCGIGLRPCKGKGLRCINGYCRLDRIH